MRCCKVSVSLVVVDTTFRFKGGGETASDLRLLGMMV